MAEQTQNKRPIDEAAKQSFSFLGNSFVFIKKTKFRAWQSIFILAYVAGAASMIFWAASFDLLSNTHAAAISCADSDGGQNYAVAGVASGPYGNYRGRGGSFKDTCVSTTTLREFYCTVGIKNYILAKDFQCQYGCLNGACQAAPAPACSDSDGGKVYNLKGTVLGNYANGTSYFAIDQCAKINASSSRDIVNECAGAGCVLQEASCLSGTSTIGHQVTDFNCSFGCKDGACLATTSSETRSLRIIRASSSPVTAGTISVKSGSYNTTGLTAGLMNFYYMETVYLTAIPSAGYKFAGWSGDCSGSSLTCSVLMDGPKKINATEGDKIVTTNFIQ
jgi:hypothetical protein